ncbi:TPA: hypothetical protein QCY71_004994 [Bacillus cereus]|nr:hypothetical protein [Bacillus cereus]
MNHPRNPLIESIQKSEAMPKSIEKSSKRIDKTTSVANTIRSIDDKATSVANTMKSIDDKATSVANTMKSIDDKATSVANTMKSIDDKATSVANAIKSIDGNIQSGSKNRQALIEILTSSAQNSLIYRLNQFILDSNIVQNALNEIRKKDQIYLQQTEKILENLNGVFKNWDFTKRLNALQEIAQSERNIALEVKVIFLELDFPPHDDLFPNEAKEIIKRYHTNDLNVVQTYVEELFLNKFDESALINMKSKWNGFEWLNNRISILEQVIEGHLAGYYNLTVPTLLAQTEGIVAQGFEHVGNMNGRKLKEFLSDLLSDDSTYSFDNQVKTFYTSKILAGFEHGKEINSSLSRHAILHGGDSLYGTKVNSLKCILIFDYLLERLNNRDSMAN